MKLRFGRARHGWLPTTLELDEDTLSFDVSYLPYDFVGELVAEGYRSNWTLPFPFDALDRLTERIEHARALS